MKAQCIAGCGATKEELVANGHRPGCRLGMKLEEVVKDDLARIHVAQAKIARRGDEANALLVDLTVTLQQANAHTAVSIALDETWLLEWCRHERVWTMCVRHVSDQQLLPLNHAPLAVRLKAIDAYPVLVRRIADRAEDIAAGGTP